MEIPDPKFDEGQEVRVFIPRGEDTQPRIGKSTYVIKRRIYIPSDGSWCYQLEGFYTSQMMLSLIDESGIQDKDVQP